LGEDFGNFITGEMDSRCGGMGGTMASDLDDPIANICLNDLNAMSIQKVSQPDFLGDIRFRFDHQFFIADLFENDLTGFLAILCLKDFKPVLLQTGDRFLEEIPVSNGFRSNPLHFLADLLQVTKERKVLFLAVASLFEGAPLVFQVRLLDLLSQIVVLLLNKSHLDTTVKGLRSATLEDRFALNLIWFQGFA